MADQIINERHGHCSKGHATPEYIAWVSMRQRCYSHSYIYWSYYGGRGISVCPEWRWSFQRFFRDMGTRPSSKHSLERIDNNGNYEPGNCKWATRDEQGANRRNNRYLTHDGRTMIIAEWAREYGISQYVLYSRIDDGWPLDKALSTPVRFRRSSKDLE